MSLKNDPVIVMLKKRISEATIASTNHIASGKCTSYDDYRKHCGIIKGHNDAIAIIDDVVLHFNDDTDD